MRVDRRPPRPGVEWEFEQVAFSRELSRNVVTRLLVDRAEHGGWELDRVRIGADGVRRVRHLRNNDGAQVADVQTGRQPRDHLFRSDRGEKTHIPGSGTARQPLRADVPQVRQPSCRGVARRIRRFTQCALDDVWCGVDGGAHRQVNNAVGVLSSALRNRSERVPGESW